jgi:hypothetical protein
MYLVPAVTATPLYTQKRITIDERKKGR